jgi:hypothetical protein
MSKVGPKREQIRYRETDHEEFGRRTAFAGFAAEVLLSLAAIHERHSNPEPHDAAFIVMGSLAAAIGSFGWVTKRRSAQRSRVGQYKLLDADNPFSDDRKDNCFRTCSVIKHCLVEAGVADHPELHYKDLGKLIRNAHNQGDFLSSEKLETAERFITDCSFGPLPDAIIVAERRSSPSYCMNLCTLQPE